jgi:predicted nucleotidyltransferase|tara:strand:- start:20184 stop:20603 length:420 start_codon:yes stop_codon:yes gene_type:complete
MPSVTLHIKRLVKEDLIEKIEEGIYPSYIATNNEIFKLYKRNDIIIRIHESGLTEFLEGEFTPDAIILFGSASRGEDIENSDIDLLIISKKKPVNLMKFEKKLNRKINILYESSTKNLPNELLNNIINGIVIYGYLKVY